MSAPFYIELQLCNADGDVVKYQRIADIADDGIDEVAAFDELARVLVKYIVEDAG